MRCSLLVWDLVELFRKFALQDLFSNPIDLLENKAVRNNYLKQEIDNSKQLIYTNG